MDKKKRRKVNIEITNENRPDILLLSAISEKEDFIIMTYKGFTMSIEVSYIKAKYVGTFKISDINNSYMTIEAETLDNLYVEFHDIIDNLLEE